MPFPRLVSTVGGGPLDVIGGRTRPRVIDNPPTARRGSPTRIARRATVSSLLLGISLGRSHLRGGISLRRRRRWIHLLGIGVHHPGGWSQNAHACDGDQSAFHPVPPFLVYK